MGMRYNCLIENRTAVARQRSAASSVGRYASMTPIIPPNHKMCPGCNRVYACNGQKFIIDKSTPDGWSTLCRRCIRYEKADRRKSRMLGHVYFVQSEFNNLIKIGYTTTPVKQRIDGLRGMCAAPITLLGSMPGNTIIEGEMHYKFRHLHAHHEWFYPGEELLAFIKTLKPN